jgi:DNA-binding response OmpR family regulator
MKTKVLVAEDSQTIQKVIKLTLSSEPFEIFECNNEESLFSKIQVSQPEIVILDFNLSSSITGYDLCRSIVQRNNRIRVFMLFGTFDTIDQEKLAEVGCSYSIVKPFDGTKFINTCRMILEDLNFEDNHNTQTVDIDKTSEIPSELPSVIVSHQASLTEEDDLSDNLWEIDSPDHEDETESDVGKSDHNHLESLYTESESKALKDDLEDWNLPLPPKLDNHDIDDDFNIIPDKIEVESSNSSKTVLPKDVDLEYPDDIEFELTEAKNMVAENPKNSDFDFELPVKENNFLEIDDEIDQVLSSSPSQKVSSIDEVSNMDEVVSKLMAHPTFLTFIEESVQKSITKLIDEKLTQKVNEGFNTAVDKIAWDVIPDLAENLIQNELKKITSSVLDN